MSKKFAFVFPGQGSQSVGMLADLALTYPIVKETFTEASQALGYDLWNLTQHGPAEKLNETQFTQPALLAAGVATWRAWREQGGNLPAVLAGHSLGEYTALVCAQAINFNEALQLVEKRGQFMQAAVPAGQGAMAAIIGLTEDVVAEVCMQSANGEVLSPANFNSPGQVVIAGAHAAVVRAIELAKERGAKLAVNLPVSVPSHCELMRPAAERLATVIENISIKAPSIPVFQNVDVQAHTNPHEIKKALIQQLYSPVRWVDTIQTFVKQGVISIVECGPGKILLGLNKRIDKNIENLAIYDTASMQQVLKEYGGT